ncbi:MAG: CHAT domain-containing protein [Cyanobacteria bacterium P01_C01_bin.69]
MKSLIPIRMLWRKAKTTRQPWRAVRLLMAVLFGIWISLGISFNSDAIARETASALSGPIDSVSAWEESALAQHSVSLGSTLAEEEAVGRALYRTGRFADAIAQWQRIADAHAVDQNALGQAGALSNLSLSYQQLGQWEQASSAIRQGLSLIPAGPNNGQMSEARARVLARSLMTQGRLQLSLGQLETALNTWQQAAEAYQHSHNTLGYQRSQLNQAQALRELGFYRQALEKVTAVTVALAAEPASALKAIALRRVGEALRLSGQLSAAQTSLDQSLDVATQINDPTQISATLLSLGHTAQSQGDMAQAQSFYQRSRTAITQTLEALNPETTEESFLSPWVVEQILPIELAQLALAVETDSWAEVDELWSTIQPRFERLPASRQVIYQQINWANSLIKMQQAQSPTTVDLSKAAQQIRQAAEQAQALSDRRAEAYALGTLGQIYEQTQQWAIAQDLTQRALDISYAENATDIAYQWQWQLGRLWKNPQNQSHSIPKALEAYAQAVDTLSHLRGDLSATDGSVQFSFQQNVEPIYRQMVSLLLKTDSQSPDYQKNLANAQNVIESLRLAELDNYFQEACLDVQPIDINQADQKAAIVYTVLLDDSLSVILHLPNQSIQHFSTAVSADEVNEVTHQLRQQLVIQSRRQYFPLGKQVYDWLIAPVREAIDESGIETLVFVLDGPLQSIPMAALYDGEHFLIEDYAVALTPGLKLLNPKPWTQDNLSALIAGVTESRQGLLPLPYVEKEVEGISQSIRENTVLLNQNFTQEALSDRLKSTLYPVVHVATHGQFGSTAEETFLLAWDELINVRDISQMLQANLGGREGIELLVLSACETASGDQKAALGLSGVAIKAGARSTLGSLWAVNDEATAEFVRYFYDQLTQPGATRAGALRKAQLHLINDLQYQHPAYWAPYILLGSWL